MAHICIYCGTALNTKQGYLICANLNCKLFMQEQFKVTVEKILI